MPLFCPAPSYPPPPLLQRSRVSELEQEQESVRRAADQRLEQEQAVLTEQTRAQAQTIGILVAEKTELKTATEQLQTQLAARDGTG